MLALLIHRVLSLPIKGMLADNLQEVGKVYEFVDESLIQSILP